MASDTSDWDAFTAHASPDSIHFKHCYAYEGAHCSCGTVETGSYQGEQPGPNMELPPAPFSLATRANTDGPWTEEQR